MRVTAKVKEQTRERILQSAHKLFQEQGFEETTTRDIAARAKIATGTLFNYFPTKEALALSIIGGCFEAAGQEFRERLRGDEALARRAPVRPHRLKPSPSGSAPRVRREPSGLAQSVRKVQRSTTRGGWAHQPLGNCQRFVDIERQRPGAGALDRHFAPLLDPLPRRSGLLGR